MTQNHNHQPVHKRPRDPRAVRRGLAVLAVSAAGLGAGATVAGQEYLPPAAHAVASTFDEARGNIATDARKAAHDAKQEAVEDPKNDLLHMASDIDSGLANLLSDGESSPPVQTKAEIAHDDPIVFHATQAHGLDNLWNIASAVVGSQTASSNAEALANEIATLDEQLPKSQQADEIVNIGDEFRLPRTSHLK